ncbi:Fc.00g054040.m01.CDS01 [Cosmosporella sp. VM-42]
MLMARQATTSKRRGRPLSHSSDGEDAALKARRERNREAQNVFRKRRQAAEAEQTKRLRRLEEIVEEMGSVFMSFVDEMLETEAVKQDAGLMGSLRRTTGRIVALAQECVGPEDDSPMAEDESNSEAQDDTSVKVPQTALVRADSSSSGSSPSQTAEHDSIADTNQSPPMALEVPAIIEPVSSPDLGTPVIFSDSPPVLTTEIYGNGWQSTPFPPTLHGFSEDWTHLPPLSSDSFAFRLAKASLTTAYLILSRAIDPPISHSEETRIFASTLRYRTREDMLARMRWLLGPGQKDMFMVANMPYGRWGDQTLSRNDLCSSSADTNDAAHVPGCPDFLSVIGVERQLVALGAKIVDSETLELNITSPPAVEPNESRFPQPESWSFVDFFSPDQLRPKPSVLTMRLSVSLLVNYLSRHAVCLLRGPGFSTAELGKAIEASIITAAGGD